MTIDMYCSAATMFIAMQLKMVVATSEPVLFARASSAEAIFFSIPERSMIPPKESAQMMRAIVIIMLSMPPLLSSLSSSDDPVVMA